MKFATLASTSMPDSCACSYIAKSKSSASDELSDYSAIPSKLMTPWPTEAPVSDVVKRGFCKADFSSLDESLSA